ERPARPASSVVVRNGVNRAARRLALRTPVGDAVVVALSARLNRGTAASATTAGAVIDHAAASAGLDRGGHQFMCGLEDGAELFVRDLGDGKPGRDTHFPERLGLRDVADSGYEPLVEESVADRATRIAPQIRDHCAQIRRLAEDVGA